MLTMLLLKATCLCAAALLAALALRRASASVRHLVWLSMFSALLLLPVVERLSPDWRPALAGPVVIKQVARTVVTVTAGGPPLAVSYGDLALWCWMAGASLLLARTITSQVQAASLRRRASHYLPGIRLSNEIDMPFVCGLLEPQVLLPEAATEWSDARLTAVLRHESAHAARFDPLAQFVSDLVCALYWPLPWVWLASRQLRMEAELACDDGVLRSGERASDYAGHLIDIVRGLSGRERIPQGGIPMARLNQLELRLRSLLSPHVNRRAASRPAVLAAALATVALLAPLGALRLPAYGQTGGLGGVVKDASGAVVPKARITVAFIGTQRREVVLSDEAGEFKLAPLPDGAYNISVAKPGFARMDIQGIGISKGVSQPLQIVLQTGMVRETMTVSGEGSPASQATAPGEPKRIRVGGNIQAVKLISKPLPAYPPECKAAGIEGSVLLLAVIGKDGSILNLKTLNEIVDRRLVDSAVQAVKEWKYQPTLLNGEPVEVTTEIEVNFTLAR